MNAFAEMTRFADRMFYRVSATIYVFMFISRLLYFLKVPFSYLSREKGTKWKNRKKKKKDWEKEMALLACGYELDRLNLNVDRNITYPLLEFENLRKKMFPQS